MITSLKPVSNPLTIIAIFAGLAEVVGTVMLGIVDESIQGTFVWFVMIFPVLIVLFFFATLNFNAKVLYAPSDFKDEANFLALLAGAKKIKEDLADIGAAVEAAVEAVSEVVASNEGAAVRDGGDGAPADDGGGRKGRFGGEPHDAGNPPAEPKDEDPARSSGQTGEEALKAARLRMELKERLDQILGRLESTQAVADTLVGINGLPNSPLQARLIELLAENPEGMALPQLCAIVSRGQDAVRMALQKLAARAVVAKIGQRDGQTIYKLIKPTDLDARHLILSTIAADSDNTNRGSIGRG